MQCHSCGADVRDGQKFCMECGASLRGIADITGEVPIVPGPATPSELRPPDGPPLPLPPPTVAEHDDTVPIALPTAGTTTSDEDPDRTPLHRTAAHTDDPDHTPLHGLTTPDDDPDRTTTRGLTTPDDDPDRTTIHGPTPPLDDPDRTTIHRTAAQTDDHDRTTTRGPTPPFDDPDRTTAHELAGLAGLADRRPADSTAVDEPATLQMAAVTPGGRPPKSARVESWDTPTGELPTATRRETLDTTGEIPTSYRVADTAWSDEPAVHDAGDRRSGDRGFRFRPMLLLAVLAAAAAVTAAVATMVSITTDVAAPAFETGDWKVNDFGTNNAIAALLAAGTMVVGALAWCWGARWGAGLAGGAGAALAGWAALAIGLAEWPIADAERKLEVGSTVTITRDVGYLAVAVAGGLGVLVLLVSLVRSGRDGHAGLDPWIAALGAASFLLAAGGPLIPQGAAAFSANYTSTTVDLPTAFFAGRLVQIGLLGLCGVVGFLMVRRYGLGLAVGGTVAVGWMLVTAATDQTDSPIGPAFANPGSRDLQPHAVTIVGMALVGFFALVAIVMALLDSER